MEEDLIDNFNLTSKRANYYPLLLSAIIFQWLFFVAGLVFALDEFESVIVFGGLILLDAIALIIIYFLSKLKVSLFTGLFGFCYIAFIFLIIYFYELSPREAKEKLLFYMIVSISGYAFALVFIALRVNKKRLKFKKNTI